MKEDIITRTLFLIFATISAVLAPASVLADSHALDAPSGRVVLEVRGSIERTNDGERALFDLAQLEALGMAEIQTESPWTDDLATFQGVPISTLVNHLAASGTQVQFLALDDYTVTIPSSDFDAYQPILATRRDGEPMRIRDRGPIWVIYPWSDYPELQSEEHYAKAIWQVKLMTFE